MKIFVLTKINRKKKFVEKIDDDNYIVWTKEPAKENKANLDIMNQLAKYFKIPKSSVILKSGQKSNKKVFEIL